MTILESHMGRQLRLQRLRQCMSCAELASMCGGLLGEFEKFESGQVRIPPYVLVVICDALKVLPSYFFEDLDTIDC